MKRPEVEDFIRLTSSDADPASVWGMADHDVYKLCNYILRLEAALREIEHRCSAGPRTHNQILQDMSYSCDLARAALRDN